MSDIAIRVEGIGKEYRIGERAQAYNTLRDTIAGVATLPKRLLTPRPPREREETHFWALQDVSFEVRHGDVVGVIGHNGSGKSTLLKILSRITEPTKGFARIQGRVGSLLEVGTGFHPELTGRENTYLNGAILGMKRAEVNRKFDEIIAFSGVEKFIDTPVKHYSSGMYLRLAFAVAAHLDPEILLIDEVLAVGDAEFQRKCLGKMRDVARGGRTVLFVSHNMAAIESLCSHAIELRRGKIVTSGSTRDVLQKYRLATFGRAAAEYDAAFAKCHHFQAAELLDAASQPTNVLKLGSDFHLQITLKPSVNLSSARVGVGIDSMAGDRMLTVHTPATRDVLGSLSGDNVVHCQISQLPLPPGDYVLKLAISALGEEIESVEPVVPFTIADGDVFNEGRGFHRGQCVAPSEWWRE
jgi:lipopolysaccharide transport system ATP-binding protein